MKYRAYELIIESALQLPELVEDSGLGEPDARISFGCIDLVSIPEKFRSGPCLWVSPECLWLHVIDIAKFQISRGCEIVIEPRPGVDEESIRVFLLGSAFGAMLIQRGFLTLHGNAIQIGDQCMICVGHSGAGKSTLAAGFMQRGYAVLADDVVPVTADGCAIPGFPRIKLWQDMATRLKIDTAQLSRIRPGIEKFNLPVPLVCDLQPLPVRWVYVLQEDRHSERLSIEAVRGMDRFAPLCNHTYRTQFLEGMGRKRDHLELCGKLSGRIHLARVQSPRDELALDRLIEGLLADMVANP